MDYTIIGKIINTHGIKGEVKVYPLTYDVERFNSLKYGYLGDKKEKVSIESVKFHKGLVILKFREYSNINDILHFKDNYIYVDDENRVVLPENHFFIYELVNCQVFNKEGIYLGFVKDVLQGASNDIYVIEDDVNNKEYLIPAVKEFILHVNTKEKKIIIDPIEGLIE